MRRTAHDAISRFLAALLCCLPAADTAAVDKPYKGPHIETDDLLVVLRPRTPEQIAAFYEARGFPQAALDRVSDTCFVTVHIRNRSNSVIWLDLAEWRFSSDGRPLERLDRRWWQAQWDAIGLRQASRSTFGWTLLPEIRDLQPDEPVGGNVVFPGVTRQFDMQLNLPTGRHRDGETITLEFGNIDCPKDTTRE